MSMKRSIYAGLLAGTALLMAGPSLAQGLFDESAPKQLVDQDIDPNQALMELINARREGAPNFKFAPSSLDIDMEVGQTGRATLNVTNTGKKDGAISGIAILGGIPGAKLATSCEAVLKSGDYCEITLTYEATTARDVGMSIIGNMPDSGEGKEKTFEIPVMISVNEPAPEPVPQVVITPQQPAPEPVAVDPRARKVDVARLYFGSMRQASVAHAPVRGFSIVSAKKDPQKSTEVAGVSYQDIRVDRVQSDERYDKSVPYTDASLPVDRDRILTSDRVIKAVLETPVSNVMCNKVVAMVESDVYSATSTVPLIQAGSRVIGECQQFVDERVGVAWSRIITTDGRSISFQDRMADTNDATGLGGAVGRIYMSPFDRYVLPIMSTMIDATAGVIFAHFGEDEQVVIDANGNAVTENSAKNEGLRIVTGEARSTAQEIIKDIRDVREIAVIPKGSRIDVEILEDIYFREDRKVVSLADMTFNLDEIEVGTAERDLPQDLRLVPVDSSYKGATVSVNGRRYRLEDDGSTASEETPARIIPEISQRALDDLAADEKKG